MAPEITKEIQLEIAHVLFIDIVGYSKLSVKDQHAAVEQLNQIVRASEQFQRADSAGRLLKVATGDGMALVFYTSPRAPAQYADLKVISRTSVMLYKSGVARNLRQIARELGVANIVEGEVQRAGNRVRVSAQFCTTSAHAK